MNIHEDFLVHDQLNKKLWDSTGKLLPKVRDAAIEIVKEFLDELELPLVIVDVLIVGSNASYTYTETSDLDLHIIANFEMASSDENILKIAYDLAKANFNKNHNITIHGINVELYIQDINSSCVSNGIYSVLDNDWVKQPKPINSVSKKNISKDVEAWKKHITEVIKSHDETRVTDAINALYLIRHNGVATDGEFSKDNLLFKEIRSLGLLDKLKDEQRKLVDDRLTLEHIGRFLNSGKLINTINEDDELLFDCKADIVKYDDSVIHWHSQETATSKAEANKKMCKDIRANYGHNSYIRNVVIEAK